MTYRFRDLSLRWKLVVLDALTTLLVLVVAGLAFYLSAKTFLLEERTRQARTMAKIFSEAGKTELIFRDAESAQRKLASLAASPGIINAAYYLPDGTLYARFSPKGVAPPKELPESPWQMDEASFALQEPILEKGQRLGTFYLNVRLTEVRQLITIFAWGTVGGVLVLSVVSLLIASRLHPLVTQPIQALTRSVAAITDKNDFTIRAKKESSDEIGSLTDAFNGMVEKIQEQDARLRSNEERIRFAMQSARVAIWEWDLKSDALACSDNLGFLFGLGSTEKQASRKDFWKLLQKSDRRNLRHSFVRAVRDRRLFEGEFRVQWAKGGVHWLSLRGQVVFNPEGAAVKIIGILMDVTDRKRTEEVLRELTTKLENAVEGIARLDSENRFMAVNRAYAGMMDSQEEEMLGRELFSTVHPADREKITAAIERMKPEGKAEVEVRAFKKSGEEFWKSMVLIPAFDAESRFTGYYSFLKDITPRKRAEEALAHLNVMLEKKVEERTKELQDAVQEMESFSYSISHDLRAPLRAIGGFARVLRDEYQTVLDEEGRRLLEVIQKNTKHLGKLIDDLLSFSRMGRREVKRIPVDLDKLLELIIQEVRQLEPGRHFEIRVGRLRPVQGDPSMIRQVFTNLISNAVKFTRDRQPAVIEIGQLMRGTENVYYIKDNGVGFEMTYADKLFNVFQRLHTQEEFEGTGVGLAIVRRIVQKHSGRIWAEGELGKGAQFYFTIPDEGEDLGLVHT